MEYVFILYENGKVIAPYTQFHDAGNKVRERLESITLGHDAVNWSQRVWLQDHIQRDPLNALISRYTWNYYDETTNAFYGWKIEQYTVRR